MTVSSRFQVPEFLWIITRSPGWIRRGAVSQRAWQRFLQMEELKDYALLRLDTPIGDTYGWLELDTETVPNTSQSVKLISHPAFRSKEIVRRNTEIVEHPIDAPFLLAYLADSEGGSSGFTGFPA